MSKSQLASILITYTSRVKVAAANAMALALLLVKVAPEELTPSQRKKLDALEKAATVVEDARGERDEGGGPTVQPLRLAFASAFAATDLALEAITMLPASVTKNGVRAEKMRAMVFPDGREFIRGGAAQACIDARRVLARIAKRKLGPQLKALIGASFLAAMTATTNDLAEALGLGKGAAPTMPNATAIADAMDAYTTKLSAYVRSIAADLDEDDAASCNTFLAAVAPIDRYRSGHTTDDTAPAPVPTPAPVPALAANATAAAG